MSNDVDIAESEVFRSKMLLITRLVMMFKTLREDNEAILKLKGLCPDNKLPKGVLLEGSSAIVDAIDHFVRIKQTDSANEKRPDLRHVVSE